MKLFERIRIQPTKLLPWILRGTYLLLLIAILYLSLRSSPSLQELPWLPDWLGAWADRHGELRTAVAYFACGLLCPWVGCRRGEADGFVRWLLSKGVLGCGLLIVLLLTEGVQFFWGAAWHRLQILLWVHWELCWGLRSVHGLKMVLRRLG